MDIAGPSPWWEQRLWCAGAAGAVVAALLALRAVVAARGTTALPAALWAVAASAIIAIDLGLRATGFVGQPAAAAAIRLLGTVLSVSPALSLLGAKRPQHGVWQFIVAALAAVVLLPSAGGALVRPGSVPDVHLLARLLLTGLLALGWMNALGTGRALSVSVMTLGVVVLARGFLPGVDTETSFPPASGAATHRAALVDCIGAWVVAVGAIVGASRRRNGREAGPAEGTFSARVDPAWKALRDTVGAAWSLRVAERFDQLAESRGWPCRLRLSGIEPRDAPGEGPWQRDARRVLEALFRRFVTRDWLVRHRWPAEGRGGVARERPAR